MKIVHVIPALTKGGAERVVVDLANAAAASGHDVTIITAIEAPSHLIADRLSQDITQICLGGGSLRASYLRLPRWIYRNRVWLFEQDVVHCHLTFGSAFGSALQRLRKLLARRRPVVVETYHAVGMAIPAWTRAAHALLLRGRDGIAFMADDPYWARYVDLHPRTVFQTIPNGIAAPDAPPARASQEYRWNVAKIPHGTEAVIGTVSRLVRARRPDLLLRAFSHLVQSVDLGVHLLLAGEGPESAMLERMARELGIARQVHMPGLVLRPADPIGAMDLFITVNVGSITGIAALEAMFLGVPVIALQLQQGYRATSYDLIWSSTNPAEVGKKAAELLKDRSSLADLAIHQQAIARARFSVDAMTHAYDRLYKAALDQRNAITGDTSCR